MCPMVSVIAKTHVPTEDMLELRLVNVDFRMREIRQTASVVKMQVCHHNMAHLGWCVAQLLNLV